LFLFSFLCLGGSSVFAAGAMMKGTSAMLPLMLVGRLVFGSGNGSLTGIYPCNKYIYGGKTGSFLDLQKIECGPVLVFMSRRLPYS
jgi:hypothetical protein